MCGRNSSIYPIYSDTDRKLQCHLGVFFRSTSPFPCTMLRAELRLGLDRAVQVRQGVGTQDWGSPYATFKLKHKSKPELHQRREFGAGAQHTAVICVTIRVKQSHNRGCTIA